MSLLLFYKGLRNPWGSIGELAGRPRWVSLGQIQNNRMAHGYQDTLAVANEHFRHNKMA